MVDHSSLIEDGPVAYSTVTGPPTSRYIGVGFKINKPSITHPRNSVNFPIYGENFAFSRDSY